jgi:hypothetical protein
MHCDGAALQYFAVDECWINHDKPQRETQKLSPAFYE